MDIAKHVYQAHGADAAGHALFASHHAPEASWLLGFLASWLLGFLAAHAPCTIAMEACAGAHYWAREIAKLGHSMRLIPPVYVKPFVKRQKNDAADAEAICEAAQRPSMRFVPVKTEEQQANGVVFRARDLLVHQRTQCVNALRGHLFKYGYVFPQGITHVSTLVNHLEDPQSALPESARVILKLLVDTFTALEKQITELDAEINRRSKGDPTARRLMTIPGVGPIASTAITALVPAAEGFQTGRDFAAWLGLTPLQKSTGGKQKLGVISKRGERTIRPAHPRRECRGSPGQPARGASGLVAGADADTQAEDVGHRSPCQQDGPRRVGSAGQRRRLQNSSRGGVGWSRPRGRRASGRRLWRNTRRDGAGRSRAFHSASSTPWVRWTQSANSHTGRGGSTLHHRPYRWQHPTTRNDPDVFPCLEGGVHRWRADSRLGGWAILADCHHRAFYREFGGCRLKDRCVGELVL